MTASPTTLISVGIDVGTTTTQLVVARLTVEEAALPGRPARLELAERAILYQAPITFTPLAARDTLHLPLLVDLVRRQYAVAGIAPEQVATGAVIITGEAARKENVAGVLNALSGLAGDFVAAAAGPRLEAIIAGKGSGAASYSRAHFCEVANLDVGGGTANLGVFRGGDLTGAGAMSVGGRLIEIDPRSRRIGAIAKPARPVLQHLGLHLEPGDRPDLEELRRFTDALAGLVIELIGGVASSLAQELYLTPPASPVSPGSRLMFSGGVGHYFYAPVPIRSVADAAVHGDLGPLLAESLRGHAALAQYILPEPAETLRATVLGASTHSLALSGSTIWLEEGVLPVRNLPVVHRGFAAARRPDWPAEARLHDLNPAEDPFAIAIDLDPPLDYDGLAALAADLAGFASQSLPAGRPLIVMLERDYARALGQFIRSRMPTRPLLVLDQIRLDDGDIVDIGRPLMSGRAVPVVVKTLIFYH